MLFSPSNIKEMQARAKQMTPIEIILAVLTGMFWTLYGFGYFVIRIMTGSYGILLGLMRGKEEPVKKVEEEDTKAKKVPIGKTCLDCFGNMYLFIQIGVLFCVIFFSIHCPLYIFFCNF